MVVWPPMRVSYNFFNFFKLPLTSEPFSDLSVTNKVQGIKVEHAIQLWIVLNLRDISVATVL